MSPAARELGLLKLDSVSVQKINESFVNTIIYMFEYYIQQVSSTSHRGDPGKVVPGPTGMGLRYVFLTFSRQ